MTTLALLPHSSCLTTTSRKRKRTSGRHVRFCTQPQNIAYTYSQSDYDRNGLLPDNINKEQQQKTAVIFALSINIIQKSNTTTATLINSSTNSANNLLPKKKVNKKPKLTIDTSNLHGPLYFTNMTTNHEKNKKPFVEEVEHDEVDILTKENTRRNSLPLVLC